MSVTPPKPREIPPHTPTHTSLPAAMACVTLALGAIRFMFSHRLGRFQRLATIATTVSAGITVALYLLGRQEPSPKPPTNTPQPDGTKVPPRTTSGRAGILYKINLEGRLKGYLFGTTHAPLEAPRLETLLKKSKQMCSPSN